MAEVGLYDPNQAFPQTNPQDFICYRDFVDLDYAVPKQREGGVTLSTASNTLNHFAIDLGLDTENPGAALGAVADGTEGRVDLGSVNGRVFVNTVSVGFYSSMIHDPQYRSRRTAVTLRYVQRALLGGGDPVVVSTITGSRLVLPEQVLTILVTNNAYSPFVAPGAALRPRMDEGMLWSYVLGVDHDRGLVGLRVLRAAARLLTGRAKVAAWSAATQTLRVDRSRVTVGIDGEAVELATPLEFRCVAGALRLLVPARTDADLVRMELHT